MAETDQILLKRFVKGDEKAFQTFVNRHYGLVLQVALRRTRHRQLAEEATQNVFCAVAKKASSLSKKPDLLLPWLHRAALFESSKAMRAEHSSQRRQKLNHPDSISSTNEAENTAWLLALPHLDGSLDKLSRSDRNVILQHYFEGKSFPAIAKQEGRPAGTIQKQCRRALDKLSRILRAKGATVSALTLAGCLTPKLAKAASPKLASAIAAQAITDASIHSTTSLSFYMLMKSKLVLPLTLAAVLLPLAAQQVAITQTVSQNRNLKSARTSTAPTKTSSRSGTTVRTRNWTSTGGISLEAIQEAKAEADRLGTLQHLEFEELIASLSKEDLVRLIPQALALSNQDTRLDLSQLLINALATIDPEATVLLVAEKNSANPLQTGMGVERALFLWTEKDPEAVVAWLTLQSEAMQEFPTRNSRWRAFYDFQAAALSELIEGRSPLAREVFSLNPTYAKYDLLNDAAEKPSPAGWHTTVEPDSLVEQADRVEAFLPWIREFGTDEPARKGRGNRGELLETVLRETTDWELIEVSEVSEELLTRGSLEASEATTVVRYVAESTLERYFNSDSQLSWTEHEQQTLSWLETHAPEQSSTLFSEARELVLKQERFQVEHKIERIERPGDLQSARGFLQIDFELFPEFLERARQQLPRITDPEERANAEAHLAR